MWLVLLLIRIEGVERSRRKPDLVLKRAVLFMSLTVACDDEYSDRMIGLRSGINRWVGWFLKEPY